MKNLTVKQSNKQSEGGEKLISYQFAGGVSSVLIVYSSFMTFLFFINFIIILIKCISDKSFPNNELFMWIFISFGFFLLGLAGTIIAGIARIKICNRYSNRGFELYSDKIVFTHNPAGMKIEQRKVALYVILSCLIPFFKIYWYWLQVKNTKILSKSFSNLYGELPLVAFIPIYSYIWMFTRGNMINRELRTRGFSSASHGTAFLILSIFGLDIIALGIMQRDFNNIPENALVAEQQESGEDSYSLTDVKKIYINNRTLFVETKDNERTMPLTSRDFRKNLDTVLKSNTA